MRRKKSRPVFRCRQCGDCCRGRGGIFVRPGDLEEMAAFLGLPLAEFCARYVENSPSGTHITVQDGACVFLVENLCQVHPVKPYICRQWPFLPALLAEPEELEHAKGACPGIDPKCSHKEFIAAARRLAKKENFP
jgi:Fe-S-cluster containining protein